jgi:serine/threonine protein phosphatase 1
MRTVAIGDIHGCYQEMLQLLAEVEISDADCLISLGDIVDRGVDSLRVYDFLRNRPNTIVLMGNHERKHLRQALSYSQEIVKLQFGDRYDEFLKWTNALPYYHETETAIFVHAALENGVSIDRQKEEVLCGCTAGEKYLSQQYDNKYWSELYTGDKPVVFGHHVVGDEPLIIDRKVYGIDTGACHGGRLTALVIPGFEIVQIQSSKDYWKEELVKWQVPIMKAKPWNTYKWKKIRAICNEFRDTSNPELRTFIAEKEQWIEYLFSLAPLAIDKIQKKLVNLVTIYGIDNFKQHVTDYSYASLLFNAHSGKLTPEICWQCIQTPNQWLKVMRDLKILDMDMNNTTESDT